MKKEETKQAKAETKQTKSDAKKPDWTKVKQAAEKTKNFLMRFKDVKEPILTSKLGPMLQNRVELIYMIGLIILGIYALVALFRFPNISAMFGGLITVFVVFVVFRMLCEILATSGKK